MHDTVFLSGALFGQLYGKEGMTVLDVGGQDINGSLREPYEKYLNMKYLSVDIEAAKGVDVVMKAGEPFPFPDESFDLIVSTSCFEHDPCFWMTFREMCRVVKKTGYIYITAPSKGPYHEAPGDNWRFYSDAAQALAYWSGKVLDGKSYPVSVEESFHITAIHGNAGFWIDFVAVWRRSEEPEANIVLDINKKNSFGPLRAALRQENVKTEGMMTHWTEYKLGSN